ncbi:MAG: hypothetical protein ACNA7Y_00770 [Gammaproteobacteria bacterium]
MKKQPSFLFTLLFLASSMAQAEDFFSLTSAMNNLASSTTQANMSVTAAINNLISGYGSKMTGTERNMLYAQSPSVGFVSVYGPGQSLLTNQNSTIRIALLPDSTGTIPASPTGADLGREAVHTILTASSTTTPKLQAALNNTLCGQPAASASSWFGSLVNPHTGANNCSYVDITTTGNNFDAKSLLGPLGYATATDAQTAANYIQFVAPSLSQPFSADITTLNNYNSPNFPSYMMALRSYTAAQSAALSTLYKSYADRVRIAGLGGQAGISSDSNAPASVLEVEDYGAKKRTTNKDWYAAMEKATPATVEREILYVLAEMRLEQYKTRLALERLNFTNALLLMQASAWTSGTFALPQLKNSVNPPRQ